MAVFANGMEISSKSMGGKSICQMPDVCFTPPQTPATPPGVPIPYPNTGMASDTNDGSTSVKIQDEQIMLKDKSAFKKSMGDEAGCAPKKGMINSKNTGKVFFIAWSMDVKVEGENVVRNLDMTTHNHGSGANGPAPMVHTAKLAQERMGDACDTEKQKIEDECVTKGKEECPGSLNETVTEQRAHFTTGGEESRTMQAGKKATTEAEANDCTKAMRCFLRPYNPTKAKGGCCPGQSPHHIPPKSMMKKVPDYSDGTAMCICLEGASQHVGSHGEAHAALDHIASKPGVLDAKGQCTVAQYNKVCADATEAQCGCKSACIEAQLNGSFNDEQKNTKVTHWQSNSKQLSDPTKSRLDNMYKAAAEVGE